MKILSSHNVDLTKYGLKGFAYYIRVSPGELEVTIKEILIELSNFSWLAKFNKEYLRKSMEHKAQATCDYLKKSFYDDQDNPLVSNAGEYIVSTLSKRSIVEQLGHLDVPLAELLGRKKVGNPGFDFFTEDMDEHMVSCGESKYVNGVNAYNTSLGQIRQFVADKKYYDDIPILQALVEEEALEKMGNDQFGVSVAFSATNISDNDLIDNIARNANFKELVKDYKIILVAVNMNEENA